MKIQEQDFYHGAALMQIVEHNSFKALNRASKGYGHYLVNTDRHVFVKYRTKSPWTFPFQASDTAAIAKQVKAGIRVSVAPVCGAETICALNVAEVQEVISLSASAVQSIRVTIPAGGSCRVSGSKGTLKRTIPHNAFPKKIFA